MMTSRKQLLLILFGMLLASLKAQGQAVETPTIPPFDENRSIVDTKEYPFSAIGRLNGAGIDRRSHCTATLITQEHILTAAHCLYFRARKRWFLPNELNFLAGYQRGDFIAHAKIKNVTAKGSFDPDAKRTERDRSGDWAILTLTKPLDIQPIPLTSSYEEQEGGKFQQSGYHRRRPHVQTFNPDCKIVQRQTNIFLHDCMLAPGDSGSPILYEHKGGYYVAGLNTSSLRRVGKANSLGLAISSDVFKSALTD